MQSGTAIDQFSKEQKLVAISRLTALWAFAESGLGGVLHALKMPFTGLVIGGLAVIIITLIAKLSSNIFQQILKSLIVVLIVKITISPYTPFLAYIAVSFQAIIGAVLYSLMNVNFISVLLLSLLAMIESAVQKLLVLTLFFGQSLWNAINAFTDFVTKQMHYHSVDGTHIVITIYISIYLVGGFFVAILAMRTIHNFSLQKSMPLLEIKENVNTISKAKKRKMQLILTFTILCFISLSFLFLSDHVTNQYVYLLKIFSWTITVIFLWYWIITPLFTRLFLFLLKKNKAKYSKDVADIISVLPDLKNISIVAWQNAKHKKGLKRVAEFLSALLQWTLTYTKESSIK